LRASCLLATLRLQVVLCAKLNDLVLEDGIADLVPSDFTESINTCYVSVFNREIDLDVATIKLLRLSCSLRTAYDL